jgi:hypothetical protein
MYVITESALIAGDLAVIWKGIRADMHLSIAALEREALERQTLRRSGHG